MAFDRDAFIAGTAPAEKKKAGFDRDAFIAASKPVETPEAVPPMLARPLPAAFEPEEPMKVGTPPTVGEARLRGGFQGAVPFIEEAVGGVRALAANKDITQLGTDYRRERDAERDRDQQTQDAHPDTYRRWKTGGAIASAAIPIPGLTAVKGASLTAKALKAAGQGGIYALGESEADLTEGQLGGAALDVAKGAATSAATAGALHGVSKGGKAAQRSVTERPTEELLKGVPAKAQREAFHAFGGKAGLAKEVASDPVLFEAAKKGPVKLHEAVTAQMDTAGSGIGAIYKQADAAGRELPVADVLSTLGKLKDQYRKAGNVPAFNAVDTEIQGLKTLWGKRSAVGAEDVHQVLQRYGKKGFGNNILHPSQQAEIGRDMNAATRDLLQDYVQQRTGRADELRALNERYSKLSAIEELADVRSQGIERGQKTLGERVIGGGKALLGGGAILSGNPAAMAGAAAVYGAPGASRGAVWAISKASQFLHAGGKKSDAMRELLANGLPRAAAEAVVEKFGAKNPD